MRSIEALDQPAAAATVAGIVSQRRDLKTKKGDPMAVVTIEDRGGRLEAVVFPETFRKYGRLLDVDALLTVNGKLEIDEDAARLIVSEVRPVDALLSAAGRPLAIRLAAPPADRATLEALRNVFGRHPGNGRVALEIELRGQSPPLRVRARLNRVRVQPSDRLAEDVEKVCGKGRPLVGLALRGAVWRHLECDVPAAERLCRELSVHPLVARLLVQRGFSDPDAARPVHAPQPRRFCTTRLVSRTSIEPSIGSSAPWRDANRSRCTAITTPMASAPPSCCGAPSSCWRVT